MLSVIVPVEGQVAATRQTLDYLARQRDEGLALEIIVVAAEPPPRVEWLLADYGNAVRRVSVPTGVGLGRAIAAGVAAVRGEYLVCLPPPTLPRPDWLRTLRDYGEAHPEVAVIASLIVDVRDRIEHAGLVIGGDGLPHRLYVGFPADHAAARSSRPVRAVSLLGAWWRRADYEAVGGVADDLDDLTMCADFCLRLDERGDSVHLCAASPLCWLGGPGLAETSPDSDAARQFRARWEGLAPDDLSRYLADSLARVEYLSPRLMRWTLDPAMAQVDPAARAREVESLLREYEARL
ncbi:MAG: glycosyltransferase family 2 protein [Anaerolineae bacterium]|nr:glycosyltransferase family 2 protein [Anaerolineae bacterium]